MKKPLNIGMICLVLLPGSVNSADEPKVPEPPVLRRFTLGAVFAESEPKTRDWWVKNCDLDLKTMVATLDACKIKVVKTSSKRGDQVDDDFAFAVEGTTKFALKDKNGRDLQLTVKSVVRCGTTTIIDKNTPTRFVFGLFANIEGKHAIKLAGVVPAEHSFAGGFMSRRYGVDATGKKFDPEEIHKKK